MVNKKQRQEMKDYLVNQLEGFSDKVEPRSREVLKGSGITSNYILVGDKGMVILVDQIYPNNTLNRLSCVADKQGLANKAFIFLKDGKTFFRDAANGSKAGLGAKRNKFSLRNYTEQEKTQMIAFRPEEVLINNSREHLQYFQPDSDRLEQGIESFKFKPVRFDYTHRTDLQNADSKRIHLWNRRSHNNGPFDLSKGYLGARK